MTPFWEQGAKKVKLDIAINDYDYKGDLDFEFTQEIKVHRSFPMARPMTSFRKHMTLILG